MLVQVVMSNNKTRFMIIPVICALIFGLLLLLTGSSPAIAQTPVTTTSSEAPAISSSESPVIRVGGSASNPPFEYLANGQPSGFNVDLVQAVAMEMGFETEIVLTTPEQARQDLLDGKIDMIAGMAYSSGREAMFDFSVPIMYTSFNLYVPSNSSARSLEDVRGKQIIVQSGTISQNYLVDERFTSQIILVNNHEEAVKLLSQNKYDGAILNRIQADYWINKLDVTNVRRIKTDLFEIKLAFAVAKGNSGLLAKLNEGLYTLNTTGQQHTIQEKWFGVYEKQSAWIMLRPYILGLGIVLALLLATLVWTWSLRRRVQISTLDLRKSEAHYRALVENLAEGVVVSSDRTILFANPRVSEILGYPIDEILGKTIDFFVHPDDSAAVIERNKTREGGGEVPNDYPLRIISRSREVRWINVHVALIDWEGKLSSLIVISDITESRRAEEQIQQQLKQMAALRAVDMAITGSMDLSLTLRVLLEQVTSQLNVDAASVLLLDEQSQQLEYAAGQGFLTNAIRDVRLQLGHGFAGQAALQRRFLRVDDYRERVNGVYPPRWINNEQFVAYIGMPLMTKGAVLGVLEIFQRSPFNADQAWLTFLESIANQAAIAIDNAKLIKDLQTANLELTLAYDATIEGWAHALELRDGETEGHSHRVAAMTVKLAKKMGISDDELVQIYRGALLHDIGKMAIPDEILKKQDTLSEDEWEIMRKHPLYSIQMLESIEFLQPSLAIPAAHHEWWDGSGYPHGLKGEEIPLAARIFTLVDVWDALIYSRRYREGWERGKVIEYLLSLSGKQFDPQIVTEFMAYIEDEEDGIADGAPE